VITRRGTPGYVTPSWYVGGHPDMYGAAALLYTLLTGNLPDKMGRSAFLWPPQGEASLSAAERAEWKRLHGIIRRATDEKVAERFVDFAAMASALRNELPAKAKLPRVLISALTLAGVAAATVLAGFRGKQVQPSPQPPTNGQSGNGQATTGSGQTPALTEDQKADYKALAGMIQGYIQDGNYANALASVEDLLSTYPQARTQPAYSIARAMALKGLGRIDEAKDELRKDIHLSPQITPMATRKDMWEEFGDLAEAENDLTRILNKFGPNTFPLFLRADIRAQRGNFAGVLADKQAALAYKPEEPEQKRLVETMWEPLATKYPGYGDYLKTQPEK
jgi:tetratricopeptide (TPR) repeat protein